MAALPEPPFDKGDHIIAPSSRNGNMVVIVVRCDRSQDKVIHLQWVLQC